MTDNNSGQQPVAEAIKLLKEWLLMYRKYANDNPMEDMTADYTKEIITQLEKRGQQPVKTKEEDAIGYDEEYEYWNQVVSTIAAWQLADSVKPDDVKGILEWKKQVIEKLRSEGFHIRKAHVLK